MSFRSFNYQPRRMNSATIANNSNTICLIPPIWQCLTLVVSLINEGKKISSVEHAVRERRKNHYYHKALRGFELRNVLGEEQTEESQTIPKFEQSINGKLFSGSRLLLSVFLQQFWRKKIVFPAKNA